MSFTHAEQKRLRREAIVRFGSRTPKLIIESAAKVVGLLDLGRWMKEQACYPVKRLRDKWEIFDLIGEDLGRSS
jgi:hypothetical protein